MNIPSFQLSVNDEVSVRERSKDCDMFKHALTMADVPAYIASNERDLKAKLSYVPQREEIPIVCDVPVIVEFYSR